jgi:transposase
MPTTLAKIQPLSLHIANLDVNQLQANPVFRAQQARMRLLSSQVSRGQVLRLDYQKKLETKDEELRLEKAKVKDLEHQLKQKDQALTHKDKLLKNKDRRTKELQDAVDSLAKKSFDQTKTISRLAGMLFKFTGKTADKSSRKRGGQPGHKGSGRHTTTGDDGEALPPDEVVRCFLANCPNCSSPLPRTNSCQSHTIIDIPKLTELLARTTQYDIEQQWCSNCQIRVMATVPQVLPHAKVGLNTIILVLIYRYTCHIPLAKIRYLLKTCYQLDLTEGAVQNILARAKDWFAGQYEQLLTIAPGSSR